MPRAGCQKDREGEYRPRWEGAFEGLLKFWSERMFKNSGRRRGFAERVAGRSVTPEDGCDGNHVACLQLFQLSAIPLQDGQALISTREQLNV